ncbi:MAG: hypothetical protein ACJ79S_08940 [Gemmatimonadaceae bacterium]
MRLPTLRALLALVLIALPVAARAAVGQQKPQPRSAAVRPAPAPDSATSPVTAVDDGRPASRDSAAAALIARVRSDPNAFGLPPADSFTVGDRVVPADVTLPGTAAVARGDLDVFGTVDGNAIALGGDVVVHPGGRVRGDVLSVYGRVRAEGGTVDGEMRALQGPVGPLPRGLAAAAPAPVSPAAATARALKISLGWLVMLSLIGIGVLLFAERYLEGVVETVERAYSRAFWAGVVGELGLIPALLVLIVALAITLVGILLIPFAVVAFWLAAMGLLTLGFVAVAQVTGEALLRGRARSALTERGATLRALVTGIALYTGLWVVAAAFTWSPVVGGILRGLAFAITWVAATAGLGAALLSRAGTRRESERERAAPSRPPTPESLDWQTPTPVTGVVAARRPTPAPMKEVR